VRVYGIGKRAIWHVSIDTCINNNGARSSREKNPTHMQQKRQQTAHCEMPWRIPRIKPTRTRYVPLHFCPARSRGCEMRRAAATKGQSVNVEAICRPLAAAADYFFGIAIK
jgi:hypothetical protein